MIWDTIVTLLATMALLVATVTLTVVIVDRRPVVTVEPVDKPFLFDSLYDWDAAEKEFDDGRGPVDHT